MAYERLYMNKLNTWEMIDTAVTTNAVTHLEVYLPKLRTKAQQIRGLYAQHAALAAARQAITQEMQQLIEEGDQVLRSLREGLKDHYGKRNEKLVEFGIEPLRSSQSRKKEEPQPPLPEAPAPADLTPDPAQ